MAAGGGRAGGAFVVVAGDPLGYRLTVEPAVRAALEADEPMVVRRGCIQVHVASDMTLHQ